MHPQELLSVKELEVSFTSNDLEKVVLHDISFQLYKNEILGVVGESGSGKSITALSILKLLPPIAKISKGEIHFLGKNLALTSEKEMQSLRGNEIP